MVLASNTIKIICTNTAAWIYLDQAAVSVPRRIFTTATTKCANTLKASTTFNTSCLHGTTVSYLNNIR